MDAAEVKAEFTACPGRYGLGWDERGGLPSGETSAVATSLPLPAPPNLLCQQ